ncbi:hypothetical protein B0H19DRAFT_1267437 [Mycena capillaripes]|nr:hypothetical protein B0H19DRAFT_1267437 [Mycena capillaripes]
MDGVPSPDKIQQTFGVLFDGFVLSMIGYGFTFFQTYVYFGEYPSDHWMQKSFVAILFSLDTASAALVSKFIYFYLIAFLPYPVPMAKLNLNPSLNTHILLSIFLAVAGFALGIAMVAMTFKKPVFAHLAATSLRVVFSLACTFVVLASLSIFIGLTHFSRKLSSPRPSSALVTLVALPHELYWIPVYSVATKSVLVQLPLHAIVYASVPHAGDTWTNEVY